MKEGVTRPGWRGDVLERPAARVPALDQRHGPAPTVGVVPHSEARVPRARHCLHDRERSGGRGGDGLHCPSRPVPPLHQRRVARPAKRLTRRRRRAGNSRQRTQRRLDIRAGQQRPVRPRGDSREQARCGHRKHHNASPERNTHDTPSHAAQNDLRLPDERHQQHQSERKRARCPSVNFVGDKGDDASLIGQPQGRGALWHSCFRFSCEAAARRCASG